MQSVLSAYSEENDGTTLVKKKIDKLNKQML
jgi:hypothetical protein